MIQNNAHKYSVSAMCKVLTLPTCTYYYHADLSGKRVKKVEDTAISKEINRIFKESCNNYDTRKITKELAVIVSDLTYVRVGKKWHYVCLFVDLFNREIIGHSTGANKTAELVYQAIASWNDVKMFHTDRGKQFANQLISEALETFGIQRSLSMKGCPYDNTVAEATFKVFKTEFANGAHFSSLELDD